MGLTKSVVAAPMSFKVSEIDNFEDKWARAAAIHARLAKLCGDSIEPWGGWDYAPHAAAA